MQTRKSARNFTLRNRLGRSGLERIIRYHVTHAEMGGPLMIPFALSNVPCSQDDTAISLSTEVAGYVFGERLHVCRLQASLDIQSLNSHVGKKSRVWTDVNQAAVSLPISYSL